jgi:peroxiredoxin Q/BCP
MAKKKVKAAKKKTKKSSRPARAKLAKKSAKKKVVKKKRLAPAAGKRTAPRKKALKKAKPAPLAKKPKAAARPKRPRRSTQALPPATEMLLPTFTADIVPPLEAPPIDTELEPPAEPAGLRAGDPAPDFELPDQTGKLHRLSDYRGRRVVLYFYPKDDTPGCTKEACGFRDRLGDFTGRNAAVLGVSPDSVDSHRRFVEKFGLTFPLLADEGHRIADQYGVWVEKNLYGKPSWGIARTTFVIDADGRIEQVFRNVKADGHEQEVLSRLG